MVDVLPTSTGSGRQVIRVSGAVHRLVVGDEGPFISKEKTRLLNMQGSKRASLAHIAAQFEEQYGVQLQQSEDGCPYVDSNRSMPTNHN